MYLFHYLTLCTGQVLPRCTAVRSRLRIAEPAGYPKVKAGGLVATLARRPHPHHATQRHYYRLCASAAARRSGPQSVADGRAGRTSPGRSRWTSRDTQRCL